MRTGPFASDKPALVCCAIMFMWYFEYSYDSTAVLKPNRSVTGVGSSPVRGTRYRSVGRYVRS